MKNKIFNPFLPGWEYIPDGEAHVFGDRLYLFGSHDRFGGDSYCQNNYVCWSAPIDDLSNWHFHGEIYNITDDPFNSEGKYCGYAPDVCCGPDGRFYLYYALSHHGSMSVAVSDTPAGRYSFYGHIKTPSQRVYGIRAGDCYMFDPAVLVDTDNSVYLYTGFSPTADMPDVSKEYIDFQNDGAYCIRLSEDMITVKGEPKLIVPGMLAADKRGFEGHTFFEAPGIRCFEGKYCFVYSSEQYHELCCAYSLTPDGPFEFGGTLVSNCDIGYNGNTKKLNHSGNNHGSIEKLGKDYYIFYHRHTNLTPFSRQACAERLFLSKDGKFCQSEITSVGLNIEPFEAEGEYPARIACNLWGKGNSFDAEAVPFFTQSGSDRECDDDQYIANMCDGAVCGFKYFLFKGNEHISIKATVNGEGVIKLYTDTSENKFAYAEIKANGKEEWLSTIGQAPKGKHPLYITFEGKGYIDIKAISFK